MSRNILKRAKEYEYLDSECYERIFHGNQACMGYRLIIDAIGIKFMMDDRKRSLYIRSKEGILPTSTYSGISRHYPGIIEPFNYISSSLDSGGFTFIWEANRKKNTEKEGQQYAQNTRESKPIYAGKEVKISTTREIMALSINLLAFGLSLAVFCLIIEFIDVRYRRRNVDDRIFW
ncbi:unnamed protein product [Allacma fusca]|uniref:Uncharacterized protein n=1 Tax=Allacma fusca TaxID=39272 RepID=A0A8J2PBM1_9HEXA|nr:unnamed protein product [Allacma fusca]